MTSVCLRGAAQVLRPPKDGLAYLRHDRAAELTLRPGDVMLDGGRIAGFSAGAADVEVDASGCAVLPGFVDCHTHLPFAGWRAEEYERKVTGVPYAEIARAGGGIASSARSLAEASDADVLAQGEALARELLTHGTTAFEGKTGYGLSHDGEARAARLGRELAARVVQPMRVTGLFAHAVPPGTTADAWMDEAEALARENLPFVRARGQTRCEAYTLATLAETRVYRGRPADAAADAVAGARRSTQIGNNSLTAFCLDLAATAAAARGEPRHSATILGATEAAREAMGVPPSEQDEAIRARALELLGRGVRGVEGAWAKGRSLDLKSALKLATAGLVVD